MLLCRALSRLVLLAEGDDLGALHHGRDADPQDGRRVYIELSPDAAHAMGLYLAAVQRAGIPAI